MAKRLLVATLLGVALMTASCRCARGQALPPSPDDPSASSAAAADRRAPMLSSEQSDQVLKLEAALEQQAKEHREYLKDTLDQFKWVVSGLLGVGIAAFTFLGYKSTKDVAAQVNARFKASVEDLANARLAEFNIFLDSKQKRILETIDASHRAVDAMSDFTAAWTYAYMLLDEPVVTDERSELARRDAMRQLEAVRADFPHWRHVGIMLARLHMHFKEHEAAIQVSTDVLEERERCEFRRGIDYAALLYSRACYENRFAEIHASDQRARALRLAAWNDINSSVEIDPGNHAEAVDDADLASLWNSTTRRKDSLGQGARRTDAGIARQIAVWLVGRLNS